MDEIKEKIIRIIKENTKLKEQIKEKDYIIENCRYKIKELKESNWSLNRTIMTQRSELKRRGK